MNILLVALLCAPQFQGTTKSSRSSFPLPHFEQIKKMVPLLRGRPTSQNTRLAAPSRAANADNDEVPSSANDGTMNLSRSSTFFTISVEQIISHILIGW